MEVWKERPNFISSKTCTSYYNSYSYSFLDNLTLVSSKIEQLQKTIASEVIHNIIFRNSTWNLFNTYHIKSAQLSS